MPTSRSMVTFWFDGVCSDDLGIVVSSFPVFSGAEPKVTKYSVPGRNGDLTYWDGTYKNVSVELKCYIADVSKIETALTAVNDWLADIGYKKLVISTELGRYRMARITNAAEIGIMMGVIAPFTIKLDCKPQRFYDDETPRVFGTSGTIVNPTRFNALPLLRCQMASSAESIAGVEFIHFLNALGESKVGLTLSSRPFYIDIDLESRRAVTNTGENVPLRLESDYPMLCPGETSFSTSNSLAQVEWFSSITIFPRWWTL